MWWRSDEDLDPDNPDDAIPEPGDPADGLCLDGPSLDLGDDRDHDREPQFHARRTDTVQMTSPDDTSNRGRRWPLWVAVGVVGVLAVAAVVTAVGASQAEDAAEDAEAEVIEARQETQTAREDLRVVRADTRAARQDLRVLRGLFAPGMADSLQAAYLLVAAEVCASGSPDAPETLQRAAEVVTGQVPGLAAHEGWEAALDPAQIVRGCAGG